VKPGETVADLDPQRKADQDSTPADADAQWEAIGGPSLMLMVKADVDEWNTFRQSPASGLHLPGRMTAYQIRKLAGKFPGWMRERASAELGPAGLTAVAEMRAMNNDVWALDVEDIFNIKKLKVEHHYTIDATGSGIGGLANVVVHYTNTLKWSWSKKIQVALFGVTLKPKPGKPLDPGRFTLEGTFEQDAPPSLYCGWEDFSGAVTLAKGPTATLKLPGAKVKVQTGLGVTFQGKLAPIAFNSFKIAAAAEAADWEHFDKEITLGAVAGGVAKQSDDPATVDTAKISNKPHLVAAQRQMRALIREFETGKADLPPSAAGALDTLIDAIATLKTKQVDPSAKAVKKNGLDPAENFNLKVTVEGWASVRWQGAANADERRRKNLELSEHRAAAVFAPLAGKLAPWNHTIQIVPMGAGIRDSDDGEVVYKPEETALAKVAELEAKLHDKDAEIAIAEKKGAANLSQLKDERDVIASQLAYYKDKADPKGKEANEETLRMVKVVVVWDGRLADLGAPSD
jgi:outer membrane protein OmpA-like peptidoglycan-associated protein